MRDFLLSRGMLATIIGVVLIHALLAFATFGPTSRAEMSELPVAVLDADQGMLAERLLTAEIPTISWVEVTSTNDLDNRLEQKEVYAGLVISENSSDVLRAENLESGTIQVELLVNEGANPAASAAAAGAVEALITQFNADLTEQRIEHLSAAGDTIEPSVATSLTQPISLEQVVVHDSGGQNGSQLPIMLVVLTWVGSLVAALVSWLALHREGQSVRHFLGSQLVVALALAIVQPMSAIGLSQAIAGSDISFSAQLVLILAVTSFGFYMLQSAVLNWLGFGGWPVLVLIWLFSFGMLAMAPETLPGIYKSGVYSWIPIRFPFEAIQGVLFFDGEGVTDRMFAITAAIAAAATVIVLASATVLGKRDLSVSPLKQRMERFESATSDKPASTQAT